MSEAVWTTTLLRGADDDGLDHVTLLAPLPPGMASFTVATMTSPIPA
jgi:hypothetical protein